MRNFFSFLFALALFVTMASAQDVQNSVGPAPVSNNVSQYQDPMLTDQIGTRAFTQLSTTPTFQFGKLFMESCVPTNIGTAFTITFPGGLMYRNGIVYTWNQSAPFQLWSIDTVTGVHTLVFNMTGVPQANFTGMCWDGTTVYGISTSITQSQIFTINMTTGACTPLGAASSVCAGAISLLGRPGAQYSLFSPDIVADNLYKWNKTNGAVTLVGPLGQNINFGQDGGVDPNDNKFYTMSYTTAPQLRVLDTATGTLGPVLCTYTAQATGITLKGSAAAPVGCTVVQICRTGLVIPIPDHQTARDSITVPPQGAGCTVADVNIRIDNVTHTWDSDLRFYIQHLTTGVRIINNVGGSGDNFINTVLNDSATTPIASGVAPFTGSFIPSSPLAPFNGSNPDGVWRILVTDTVSADTGTLRAWCVVLCVACPVGGIKTIEIPNTYSLNQNYPNPFNPTTTIKFGVPTSEVVRLTVYDILGREVRTLVNELKSAGTYEVSFDASALSSGVYFYKLETPSYSTTKRMLLVK